MRIKRYKAIPRKLWKNAQTGQTASIYGALPYYGERGAWEIVTIGWTIRDNLHNTVGGYNMGKPFATEAEAVEFIANRLTH